MQADEGIYLRKQDSVVIRSADGDHLVALIEIVSRGNKESRHEMDRFLRKVSSAFDVGCHLLVVDLQDRGTFDPQGIHGAIWEYLFGECPQAPEDRSLTLVSYCSGDTLTAYVEPVTIGANLQPMPLFLDSECYVEVPLEETYLAAWEGLPAPWKREMT